MRNQKFSASKRKAQSLANNEKQNRVQELLVEGLTAYRSDGTVAFLPDKPVELDDIWQLTKGCYKIFGWGRNEEAGMNFIALPATIHAYSNGLISIGLYPAEGESEKTPCLLRKTPKRQRKTVRNRVVSSSCGIVREGEKDVTLRIRVSKNDMATSGSTIRELLDREVYKLLSQLPS